MDSLTLVFKVKGSQPEPYEIIFEKHGTNFTGRCNCKAGVIGTYCKHRLSLLDGDITDLVSDNADAVNHLRAWIKGTNVEQALVLVLEAERELEAVSARLKSHKKALARALND